MFEIIVNGKKIQLLQPITDVKSIIIKHVIGFPIPIKPEQTKAVAEWLYNLTQAATTIEYNGILMDKASVNKPKHMK